MSMFLIVPIYFHLNVYFIRMDDCVCNFVCVCASVGKTISHAIWNLLIFFLHVVFATGEWSLANIPRTCEYTGAGRYAARGRMSARTHTRQEQKQWAFIFAFCIVWIMNLCLPRPNNWTLNYVRTYFNTDVDALRWSTRSNIAAQVIAFIFQQIPANTMSHGPSRNTEEAN